MSIVYNIWAAGVVIAAFLFVVNIAMVILSAYGLRRMTPHAQTVIIKWHDTVESGRALVGHRMAVPMSVVATILAFAVLAALWPVSVAMKISKM